ncbi:MAG: hypothetical protein ACI8WB_004261 [Phenylobacterium sp.]
MNFKPTLSKLASLSLLLTSNVYAAPFFDAPTSTEQFKAQAQAQNLAAAKPSIENATIYNVNAKALTSTTKQIELNLLPDLTVYATKQSVSTSASGGIVWNGSVSKSATKNLLSNQVGPQQDSALLINRDGKITGTVRTDGRLFKIQPLKNGLHMVTEIDEDNMKPDHPPGAMAELEHQLTERLANQSSVIAQPQQATTDNSLLVDPVIRVMVLYTNGVSGEVADIPGLIDLAVAETNTGYSNSGVNATVELAHLGSINYTSSSISTDLTRLKATNDGYMDTVHALRNTHAADIVMLIVPDSGSSCGQAGAIGAVESTAFAVTAQDCATGYYSFGHEMGHLQSARHNPETDGTTTPFAYGHGYRDPASAWRTVMAYNCSSGCSRINWWSNPNNTRSGTAMGTTSTSHNARVLNETAAAVAGFRGTSTPPTSGSELQNGVAETNISAATGAQVAYTFNVPSTASDVNVVMSGGTGDADLYVKFGSAATTSSYDCRPYAGGNSESCPSTAQTGTYHVMLNGYAAFSGVSLTASYTETSGGTGGNMSQTNLSGSTGAWDHYTVVVPAGMGSLDVTMSGGTGDADMYVRKGAQPTSSTYDCRPYKTGNSESCPTTNPGADTYHISIYGYSAYTGVALNAVWAK